MFPFYGLLVICVTYSSTVKKKTICSSETSMSRYASFLCPGSLRYLLLSPEDGGTTLLRNVSESLCFLISWLPWRRRQVLHYSETSVSLYASLCSGCLRYLLLNPEDGGTTLLRNVNESLCFLMSRLLTRLTPQPWRWRNNITPKCQWVTMLPPYVHVTCVTCLSTPQYGRSSFFRNIGELLPDCTVSYLRG
jgi:hypothetical protein